MPVAHRIRLYDGAQSELDEEAACYLEVHHGGIQERERFLLLFAGRSGNATEPATERPAYDLLRISENDYRFPRKSGGRGYCSMARRSKTG
jgi:hypothetical protein